MVHFQDAYGIKIRDGSRVYFKGKFPKEMPVLEPALYADCGAKHAREGFVYVINGRLVFLTRVGGEMRPTGLGWEYDGERCYDLMVIKQ